MNLFFVYTPYSPFRTFWLKKFLLFFLLTLI